MGLEREILRVSPGCLTGGLHFGCDLGRCNCLAIEASIIVMGIKSDKALRLNNVSHVPSYSSF